MINGGTGQLIWNWNDNCVKLYNSKEGKWGDISYDMASAENGYNQNIGENMYIDELRDLSKPSIRKNLSSTALKMIIRC